MTLILNSAQVNAVQTTLVHLNNVGGGSCTFSLRGKENTAISVQVTIRGAMSAVKITQYNATVIVAVEEYGSFSVFEQQYLVQ